MPITTDIRRVQGIILQLLELNTKHRQHCATLFTDCADLGVESSRVLELADDDDRAGDEDDARNEQRPEPIDNRPPDLEAWHALDDAQQWRTYVILH